MEETSKLFDIYQSGEIVSITWNRDNGVINEDYVYFGKRNNSVPILKHYGSCMEELSSPERVKQIPSLDVLNIGIIHIKKSSKPSLPENFYQSILPFILERKSN